MVFPKMGAPSSGVEMMLRSMGLGEMIEVAKQFAESGVLEKIVQFADGLEALNERLDRIERAVREHGERPGDGANSTRSENLALAFDGRGENVGAPAGGTVAFGDEFSRRNGGYVFPAGGDERIRSADIQPDLGSAAGSNSELRDVGLSHDAAAGGFAGPGDARSPDGVGNSGRSRKTSSGGGSK